MEWEVCVAERERREGAYILRTFDISLAEIEERLRGLEFTPEVSLSGVDLEFGREEDWRRAKEVLKDFIYSDKGEPMEVVVGKLLRDRGLVLSTAESCTGGLLSARIVNVPGSSEYFLGGVVVYSNELKRKLLGVREETLREFGAVSKETCSEMLKGLRERFGTHCGIAITGIAGPGGSENKPQGLTYVGVFLGEEEVIEERVFTMGRNPNRFLSSQVGLNLLRRMILKREGAL